MPVLVHYWADWCGPCRVQAPVLEAIGAERPNGIVVAQLDVDAHPTVASRFAVATLPTLLLFRRGRVVLRMANAQARVTLLQRLNDYI